MKSKNLIFLIALGLTVGCGPANRFNFKSPIPVKQEKADRAFPEKPVDLKASLASVVRTGDLSQILSIREVIPLETNDDGIIGEVWDLLLLDNTWFVTDKRLNQVLQFSREGRFLRRIGRKGQGPGEYEMPWYLTEWDGRLVVADVGKGAMHIYETDGKFVKSMSTWAVGINIQGPLFFHANRLFLSDFGAPAPSTPSHVVFDAAGRKPKILYGFGERFALAERLAKTGVPRMPMTAFTRVGDTVWTASPYDCSPKVYDLEGRYLAGLPAGVDGVTYDDFEGVNTNDEFRKVIQKPFSHRIIHLSPLVMVHYWASPSRMSLFDTHGNLLRKHLEVPFAMRFTRKAAGDVMVSPITLAYFDKDELPKRLSESEYRAALDAGLKPGQHNGDNPYLFLYGLAD
ncbi:MAG: 6-bladed beta-propeller [Acidobacteriota bacterium]|nr:6-bladed beta-propeller [Acidobacteriota bacterium]